MNRRMRRRYPTSTLTGGTAASLSEIKDLMDIILETPINIPRIIYLVDVYLSQFSIPSTFDRVTHSSMLLKIHVCIRGIYRIVSQSSQFRTDVRIHREVMTFWPRLAPWCMYIMHHIVVEYADFVKSVASDHLDYFTNTPTYAVQYMYEMISLDEVKRTLAISFPGLLINLTNAWIVAVEEHVPVCNFLYIAIRKWIQDDDQAVFGDISRTINAIPMPRLMNCLFRIISFVQERPVPLPWDVLRNNMVMFFLLCTENNQFRLNSLLKQSIPWICRLITYIRHYLDKYPEEMQRAAQHLTVSFAYLAPALEGAPEWIIQAVENRIIVSLAWFSKNGHLLSLPQDLNMLAVRRLFELLTINTIWRSVLRPTYRSLRHIDFSFLNDDPGDRDTSFLVEKWRQLRNAVDERWGCRCTFRQEEYSICMNTACNIPRVPHTTRRLLRCTGCGSEFCSTSCQKLSENHKTFCVKQQKRRKEGYPEDPRPRDYHYVRWVVQCYYLTEKEHITAQERRFSQEHGSDAVGVICLNFISFPVDISVGLFDTFRDKTGESESQWREMWEQANQERRPEMSGQLLLTMMPCGRRPLIKLQWIEDVSDIMIK
ncbi:uncharacterized protein EV420DRAFT_1641548 [Desarmillaria tabescens]|uniref:MYND-type domain-containing protein n=1 Tax=Armillaria tabescens TaxID=1929756 RepID=A0AA39KFH6_ARMTA|nr:uncharacterized protein EV420DRAFT_1641548 [Desarmillaria tabescens]KAK0460222.1 hypothetical protein EV420DRAFT_1641548 [Desarmillaria tabescens]